MSKTPESDRSGGELPLREFLTYRLNRLHGRLHAQGTRYLAQHADITVSEWRAIAMISDLGQTTLTAISREGQLDKGLLSRTIKSLIARNYVQARQDLKDQRVQLLKLTRKGQSLFDRTLPRMQARQRFLRSSLNDEELETLFRAFDKLDQAAEETEFTK